MREVGMDSNRATPASWFMIAGLGWLAILTISYWRYQGPALLANPTDPSEFHGARCEEILKRLVGNNAPHPVGSADHKRVREEIVGLATSAGYQVELQSTHFDFAGSDRSVPLVNILFRLKGTEELGRAAMLVAHYDSAPLAPGAGDDGAGVAVLIEVARTLKSRSPPKNDVIFLITDGEELGLLGASKFCEEHPWAEDVEACVNLEARGTSGPSLMFQTGEPNGWLAELMGRHLKRPNTSSLFFEIYRRLPNDTDFTVFRKHGWNGYNFAFIGDIKNYHTAGDNFANISRNSLQHHGDNALQALSALANCEWTSRRGGNAVYFDVFGWWLIWWPADWTFSWALGILVLASLIGIWHRQEKYAAQIGGIALAFGMLIGATILAALASWGLGLLLAYDGAFQSPWPAAAFVLLLAYWLTAAGWFSVIGRIPLPFARTDTLLTSSLLVWASMATLASCYVVGSSYLFLVPASIAAVGLLAAKLFSNHLIVYMAAAGFCLAVGLIWVSQEALFYDALGFRYPWLVAARASLATSSILPLLAGVERRIGWTIAAVFLTAVLGASAIGILMNRAT